MKLEQYLRGLTTAQLARLWGRVWERVTRGDGYQPYGYDWPTLAITHPGWYGPLRLIVAEAATRKE